MDLSKLKYLKYSRLVHLCFAITFFTSGLIVNFIQCILYLTLRPINKTFYRKLNWYLCATLYSRMYNILCLIPRENWWFVCFRTELVFMGDWWSGSKIILYMNKEDFHKYWGKEHAYCVMNHTYEIDWLIGWMICDRIHMLGVSSLIIYLI